MGGVGEMRWFTRKRLGGAQMENGDINIIVYTTTMMIPLSNMDILTHLFSKNLLTTSIETSL
jgi:hypothetical protein